VLMFPMVRQVPTQFLDVLPRPSDHCSRPARVAQFGSPFVFHNFTNPFSSNPLAFTSIQNARGYRPPRPFRRGVSVPARTPIPSVCQAPSFQQVAASCTLLPLFFEVARFRISNLQPLYPKYRGWGGGVCWQSTFDSEASDFVQSSRGAFDIPGGLTARLGGLLLRTT